MARAAVRGRLTERLRWRIARLVDVRDETPSARTLVLQVVDWPGHLAGQHVDVRLSAPDGYTTQRSYSIASTVARDLVELTVQIVPDGEVSPYLAHDFAIGDAVELRGPIGGWFAWAPSDSDPVLLVAGGSGIVPLMAMVRARAAAASSAEFRLLYSVRTPADVYYAHELVRRDRDDDGLDVTLAYTRSADSSARPVGRLTSEDLVDHGVAADLRPRCYVCGPTGFVEYVADLLVELGHDPALIRTERFGPSGG